MTDLAIDVIIRTRDCDHLLEPNLGRLQHSSITPRVILVDNGSVPSKLRSSKPVSAHLKYSLPGFNYAMAINLAIPFLESECCLIISAHSHLVNLHALEYAVGFLKSNPTFAGLCFSDNSLLDDLAVDAVTANSFNGWNGLWNTASLYRTRLLRERPFNPECFSAEDQEWSAWALFEKGLQLGHVKGCGLTNENVRSQSMTKRVREWESISYYSYRAYLEPRFILRIFLRSARAARRSPKDSIFWLLVFFALCKARYVQPLGRSAYY